MVLVDIDKFEIEELIDFIGDKVQDIGYGISCGSDFDNQEMKEILTRTIKALKDATPVPSKCETMITDIVKNDALE